MLITKNCQKEVRNQPGEDLDREPIPAPGCALLSRSGILWITEKRQKIPSEVQKSIGNSEGFQISY
jgi:hypothetical protein